MKDTKMKNNLLLFLMALAGWSSAQDSLRLDALIDSSLNNNYDIQISAWSEKSTSRQNTLGNAGFSPTISLAVGDRLNVSNRDNPTSFINGRITSNNLNPTVELNQTLFNGFTAHANKRTFDLLEENSFNNSSMVINNNLKALLLTYYRVQVQYLTKEYQEENLKLTKKLYRYNKKKWDKGLITINELDTYEVFVLEDSISILNTETAIQQLTNLVEKISRVQHLKIKKERIRLGFSELDNLEVLSKQLDQNPLLKSVLINEKLKQEELIKSRAKLYPIVNLNAGYSQAYSRVTIESRGTVNGEINDTYIGLSLNFNLFNGFKARTQVALSEIDREVASLDSEKQLFELRNTLKGYFNDYHKALNRLTLSRSITEISNSTLNYWVKKEKVGLITSLQLRDYQKSVLFNKQVELRNWLEAYQQRLEIQSLTDPTFKLSFLE